jgi:ATP-dependent Clp protease ATP-binding subunit ClpA
MMPRKQTKSRPQTVAAAKQTAAAAEAMLKQLQAQLERHTERGIELEAARKQASYGAHALDDLEQRKALNDVVDESVRHETQGRSIADAIEEARRRVVVAQVNEAAAADRQRTRQVLEIVAEFRECGRVLDAAARALGEKSHELGRLLQALHGYGVRHPSYEQWDVFGDAALRSSIANTVWAKRFRVVAPLDRKEFGTLVSGWADMIEARLKAEFGEQKKDEAA